MKGSLFRKNKAVFTHIILIVPAIFIFFWLVLRFSPYPQLSSFLNRPNSIRYYDRNGILLQITPLEGGLRREKPHEIPQAIKDVFVFAEDKRFFYHPGIDGFSIIRALYQNIRMGRTVSGASTITMQLARLIENDTQTARQINQPGNRHRIRRKIAEIFNALRLEARFSKEEILETYLNSLPFGYNTEGVASAARAYFSSDLEMLSPAQIFCLAVIPRRPGLYNPVENPGASITAASYLQAGFANNRKLRSTLPLFAQTDEEDFKFAVSSARRFVYPFELPHLIRSINAEVLSSHHNDGEVFPVEIHLSVDLALQHFLEKAIAANVAQHYHSRLTNGAALAIDNETGEILAWVGSTDFFNSDAAGQIDGVLALNQPGSSMKPFLYAMALENGYKPTDVLADIQMTFGESTLYIPRNFNNRYNGPVLFRAALASSLNIPAVHLLNQLSVDNFSDLLLSLGFDSIEKSVENAGLGLALGNAPVSLLELVRAFSVFPRDGVYLPLTWKLPVASSADQNVTGERIFSNDTARIICSFLSDQNARVLTFGYGGNFRTPFPAIFKTGTANQFQSITALGASQRYSAGVWMGNFTGETVIGRTGSSVPAAIVRDALTFLEEQSDRQFWHSTDFPSPENWETKQICAVSGMMPTEACLSVIYEFVRGDEAGVFCTWHRMINGRSETVFPAEYQGWFNTFNRQGSLDYSSRPLEIVSPRSGFVYLINSGIGSNEIRVEVIGGEAGELRVTHNNSVFYTSRPFVFYLPLVHGINTLHVQNGDEEDDVIFTVQ